MKMHNYKQKIKILISYHKPAVLLKNEILTPIHVGRIIANEASKDGLTQQNDLSWMNDNMAGDDTGNNISHLNRELCELTGMYWAWKNQDKLDNPDYIGFMHYRRHFIFNKKTQKIKKPEYDLVLYNAIDKKYIEEIGITPKQINDFIGDADIVAYSPLISKETVYNQFKNLQENPIYDLDFEIFDDAIKFLQRKHPEYKKTIKKYLNGKNHFWFNVFIMKKEIFNDYCKWLFEILFELHDKIDYSRLSIKGRRVLGFIAERLHGIYLTKLIEEKKLNIKYAPLTMLKYTEIQEDLYPAFQKDNIAVCFSSDNNYIPYLGVVIQSIISNSSKNKNYDIIILEEDISKENKQKIISLGKAFKNISIRFYNVSKFMNSSNKFYLCVHFKIPTYYRLFMSSIFYNYEKVIYLDIDTIVLNDISKLYETDISKNLLGAVNDFGVLAKIKTKKYEGEDYFNKEVGVENVYKNYFQAGVLLFNIKKIIKDNIEEKLFKTAATKKFNYVDQDVLNFICFRETKMLNSEWNVINESGARAGIMYLLPTEYYKKWLSDRANPKIIHYASVLKPWHDPNLDLAEHWWHYARMTPFYEQIIYQNTQGHCNSKFNILDERLLNLENIHKNNFVVNRLLSFKNGFVKNISKISNILFNVNRKYAKKIKYKIKRRP